MKKIKLNLRGKLLGVVIFGLLFSFSLMGAFRVMSENKIRVVEINYSGQDRVTLIAYSLSNLILTYDYGNIESLAERIVKMDDVEQIKIMNRSGKVIATRNSQDFNLEKKGMVFGAPVIFSGEAIGSVEIVVSLDRLESAIRATYQNVVAALSLATIFLGTLIYASVSVFVVSPVLRLSKAADQLALGDFDALLPPATKDELGKLVRAFSSMRENRRSSEAKLIAIFENAPDGFIQLDDNGLITNWNDNAAHIFGYTKNEVIGKVFDMVMSERNAALNPAYKKSYQAVENYKVMGMTREVVGKRRDGSLFPLELKAGEVHFEGGDVFLVSIMDISERRENENKLLNAMNAAEAANAAKSTFMSNMSHEIRTPMNNIIGMSKLALKTQLNAKQHDYLTKIDYVALQNAVLPPLTPAGKGCHPCASPPPP